MAEKRFHMIHVFESNDLLGIQLTISPKWDHELTQKYKIIGNIFTSEQIFNFKNKVQLQKILL